MPSLIARILIALALVCALSSASAVPIAMRPHRVAARAADAPAIFVNVVYPSEGATLPYVLRSFVFGAATPGATVSVNGQAASAAASGGWIAFVPFQPGNFSLRVAARRNGRTSVIVRNIIVAPAPQTLAATPARIDGTVSPSPAEDMRLQPGDVVHLFLKASAGARVSATFGDSPSAVELAETSVSALSPSDKERALGDAVAGGANIRGLYEGDLRIPADATGSTRVKYTVVSSDGSSATALSKGAVTIAPVGWYRVGTIVLQDHRRDIDARPYGIVEDEPDGGWLFFPTAGTPFAITGAAGDYYRVALGTAQSAWIDKHDLAIARAGTPAPHAQVQDIEIYDGARASTVMLHLTHRVPYCIDESTDGPSLRVRVFGASGATDFVRYGADRSNVGAVRWDQLQDGVATISISLRQHALWGYHASWNGNAIQLVIKKPPVFRRAPASALAGLLVVIDPGHSPDTGAIGPLGTQERDVNLAIARRLAAHLQALGARAVLTRYANVPVGLYDRTLLAQRLHADVLISVHNNALPDGIDPFAHHGYSVYYYQPQSLALARALHAAYARHTNLPDYGLYYDNLALARPTDEPAVLTESAFVMWPAEEMLLRSARFQDTLGLTLADGLERWAEAMRALETGG